MVGHLIGGRDVESRPTLPDDYMSKATKTLVLSKLMTSQRRGGSCQAVVLLLAKYIITCDGHLDPSGLIQNSSKMGKLDPS
jgi:hypothetical protein